MIPFICPGDLLTIRYAPHSTAAVGDIVLGSRDGRFYVHRVLRTWSQGNRSYFQTRGDALPQADPVTPAGQFLGRVTAIERRGKQIQYGFGIWNFCLAALVRRSNFINRLFLHCHSIRIRLYSSTPVAGDTAFGNCSGGL
jgi:hypothetical protein